MPLEMGGLEQVQQMEERVMWVVEKKEVTGDWAGKDVGSGSMFIGEIHAVHAACVQPGLKLCSTSCFSLCVTYK